jgi:heme-degrading monooxygenase HmoA
MIGRLWRTGLQPSRGEAYERFAREVSLPMFRKQDGFLGCLMSRTAEFALVFTLWRDHAAIEALDHSPLYRATVTLILEAGLVIEPQSIEITEVHLLDLVALPRPSDGAVAS